MHSTQEKKLNALGSELTKDIKTGEDLSSLPRSPNKGFPHEESALRWLMSRRNSPGYLLSFSPHLLTQTIHQIRF